MMTVVRSAKSNRLGSSLKVELLKMAKVFKGLKLSLFRKQPKTMTVEDANQRIAEHQASLERRLQDSLDQGRIRQRDLVRETVRQNLDALTRYIGDKLIAMRINWMEKGIRQTLLDL